MNARSETPRFRRARREAVTGLFAAAAEAVIARKGYAGATMHDIAREAGCASGTLYLYFRSKEELFSAIVARHMDHLVRLLREARAQTADPVEKIRRSTSVLLDYFNSHLATFRLFYTADPGGRAHLPSSLPDRPRRDYLRLKRLEVQLLKQAQSAGKVRRDCAAADLVEFMHGLVFTTLARWSVERRRPARDEQWRRLWGFIAGGLGIGSVRR